MFYSFRFVLKGSKKGEKMKKNNKGFSLVELIVVILIMAILGVALTPQVMKWVNNSRISSDIANYEALVSATQLTLGNEAVYNYINGVTESEKTGNGTGASQQKVTCAIRITMGGSSVAFDPEKDGENDTKFVEIFKKNMPDWNKATGKTGTYYIFIKKDGTIVRDTTLESKRNDVN